MQATWSNVIARFRKESSQTRPKWPQGWETHFSSRENLRNSQALARKFRLDPDRPSNLLWPKKYGENFRIHTFCNPAGEAPYWISRSQTQGRSQLHCGGAFASANPLSFLFFVVHSASATSTTAFFEVSNVPVKRVVQHEQASVGSVAHRPCRHQRRREVTVSQATSLLSSVHGP